MKQIGLSQKYKVKVVGIYGVGGIGKTTTCKILCNELSSKFEGRVCHVEFDNTCSNSKELWHNAVMKLIRKSADFVHQLDEGECENVLYKDLSNQRTFLAIDNIWDNNNSIKQAKMFLKTPFHKDSLVVVTARSQSTLALLGINEDACLEMPELGQEDATSLFLYYASDGEQFTSREDIDSIEWCVKKCYFCKGDGRGYHYHPLALEALGRQLGCLEEKPSKWIQLLSRVWKFSSFSGDNVVFDVLRSSFDLLQPIEQTLFMDLGFFFPHIEKVGYNSWDPWIGWMEKLCILYKKDEFQIQNQLNSLKRKGLLQDANLTSGRITMHDLYSEFVRLEAVGKLTATTDMWDRKWVLIVVDDGDLSELEVIPTIGCWQKLSRLSILQNIEGYLNSRLDLSPTNPITNLEGIEWHYFSNVLVLQLYGLKSIYGRLNLKGMTCLRSLQLYDLRCLESLEGLESLKHLTSFEWKVPLIRSGVKMETHFVGQFPTSLKYLCISRQCVLLASNVLAHCNNLIKLRLVSVEVGVLLDLSNCSSLEGIQIYEMKSLQTLLGLTAIGSSRLKTLEISCLDTVYVQRSSTLKVPETSTINKIHVPGLDQLGSLVQLFAPEWEVPCLLSLTKLQVLTIGTHAKPAKHCIPHQLQELHYYMWRQHEAPCLNAFKQLQILDFSWSNFLTQMDEMGDLPALRILHLGFCDSLERLPDLSKSKKLEELILDNCIRLKLYDKDFEMLATLPLLQPVRFSQWDECNRIRLNIIRRKVLQYLGPISTGPDSWLAWKEGELEELELGPLPIELGNRGVWDIKS